MRSTKAHYLGYTAIAFCMLVAAPGAAKAEDQAAPSDTAAASAAADNKILVTARRREEAIEDVPVALSVVGAVEIDRLNMTTLEDITDRTPGVQFSSQATLTPGRFNTSIRFRGMDTSQTAPSQQLGMIFLDGISISTGVQSLDLGSLERVEVIKGPQSATFGRSTFGGAINYVMKTPSFTPHGRVATSIAEYGTYDVALSHEGPLSDKIAYRVSLRGFGTDGQYVSAYDGGKLGQERTTQGSLTLYAEPTESIRIKLNGYYGQDRDGQNAGVFVGNAGSNHGKGPALANCDRVDPTRAGKGATDYFCGNINDIVKAAGYSWDDLVGSNTVITPAVRAIVEADLASGRTKASHVPKRSSQGLSRDALRLSGSAEFDVNGGGVFENSTVNFLTGYNSVGVNLVNDFDHSPVRNWIYQDTKYDRDWATELRWSSDQSKRIRASLGASYFDSLHEEGGGGGVLIYDYFGDIGVATPFGTPTVANPVVVYTIGAVKETGKTYGIFGYLGFDITDSLTLDLEGRYQVDKIGQDNGTVKYSGEFNNFLPRVTLSYKPSPDATIWATWSKGNLPGFFNSALPGLTADELAQVEKQIGTVGFFNDEEKLTNYEIGWRQAFGDALNFSLVGYLMDWTNQKARVGVAVTNATTGATRFISLQANAGDSRLWGVEFETNWRATRQLSGSFSVNYSGAEYTEFTCSFSHFVPGNTSGRVPCEGNRPPKFPDWSGSAMVALEDQLSDKWDYFVIADGTYFGKAYNEETNYSWIGDTFRANLRFGVKADDLKLEAFVTNLFDNDDLVAASRTSDFTTLPLFGFSNNFGIIATPPKKRTVGLRATFDF